MITRTLYVLCASLTVLAGVGCATQPPTVPLDAMTADLEVGQAIAFRDQPDAVDRVEPLTDRLTQADAIRLAVLASPTLQQSLAKVRIAQAEAWQTRLLPNPILTVALRFPEAGGKPIIEAGLAADLLSLLQRPGKIEAADARLRAACAEAVGVALDVIAETEEHYIAIGAAEAATEVLRARVTLLDKLLELARSRLKAGEGTQLDVATLEAQQVELASELAERREEVVDERLALGRLIGQPSGKNDWAVDSSVNDTAGDVPDERLLLAEAESHRPELAALRWELTAAGVDVRLAKFAPFDGSDVGVAAERDGRWSLGPALATPLPLFDWGQARTAREAANRMRIAHQLVEQRRKVIEDVRRAFAALRAAKQNADRIRTGLIPLQQRRRELAEAAFRTGTTDVTTLVLADNDLQTARARLVELDRKAALSLSKLRRAVGGAVVPKARPAAQPTTVPTTAPAR